jgi:hypothetical protein
MPMRQCCKNGKRLRKTFFAEENQLRGSIFFIVYSGLLVEQPASPSHARRKTSCEAATGTGQTELNGLAAPVPVLINCRVEILIAQLKMATWKIHAAIH